MLDREKDRFIRQQLQKDKLISKKADDVINNFLKEDFAMNKEKKIENQKIQNKNPWKKFLAAAACLIVVFGAANVYAYTQGYGNIFFMIKYLITGQNEYVEGKDAILSDRDITITYEPINITENLSLIIKKIQIKDNNAKLILVENQKQLNDSNLQLIYEVTDNDNTKLCDSNSILEPNSFSAINELELKNFKNNTKIINLKISNVKNQLLANLKINIEDRTVEVVGEQEALQKISEIELKEFLGYAAEITEETNMIEDSVNDIVFYNKSALLETIRLKNHDQIKPIIIDGLNAYNKKDMDTAIEEMIDIKAETIGNCKSFIVKTYNGTEYYKYAYYGERTSIGECININNISFCNGIYTITYTLWYPPDVPLEEIRMNESDVYEQTLSIKINENPKYSKFKIVSSEKPIKIQGKEITIEENEPNPTETALPTETTIPTPTVTPTVVPTQTQKPVDNYATSMTWSNYWAPGLKFQYPTEFKLTDTSTGNNPGELAVTIEGLARGINKETNEIIDSNLTIEIYEPKFISKEEGEAFKNSGRTGLTNNRGMFWGMDYTESTDKKYTYKNVEPLSSGDYVEHKIVFDTNNRNNYKVINIENWILGSTQETSY